MIEYDSPRSRREPWTCFRHAHPDQMLSPSNRDIVKMLMVTRRDDCGDHHFFDGQHGIVTGPGFRAVADDWPVGTKLVVAVRVLDLELPASTGR